MNENLNYIDFKKQYQYLVTLPSHLLIIFAWLFKIVTTKGLIVVNDDLGVLIFLFLILAACIIMLKDKIVVNFCIKKQYSYKQLKKVNDIGKYIYILFIDCHVDLSWHKIWIILIYLVLLIAHTF